MNTRAAAACSSHGPAAFTLVELLVVVAIIALLLGILIPSLGKARKLAERTTCMSNLSQIAKGTIVFDTEHNHIPFGPAMPTNDGTMMTNQVRAHSGETASGRIELFGMGLLRDQAEFTPKAYFCPGDDSRDHEQELAQLTDDDLDEPVYSSYGYRQLDETDGARSIASLGDNTLGQPARLLVFDMNWVVTVDPTNPPRFNHGSTVVNAGYIDGSVQSFANHDDQLSLRNEDLAGGFAGLIARIDHVLQDLDAGYGGGEPRAHRP
jgi:prepilin-type N-terminal cleavage/methylation domain-containing protein